VSKSAQYVRTRMECSSFFLTTRKQSWVRTGHVSNILADREFSTGNLRVSSSCLFFSDGAVTGFFPTALSPFSHSTAYIPKLLSSSDLKLWPVTLTIELDLDSVKMNQRARYLGHNSFRSKVIDPTHKDTRTQRPNCCTRLLNYRFTAIIQVNLR